jgi:phospholipase C
MVPLLTVPPEVQMRVSGFAAAIWLLAASQCSATPLDRNDDKTTTPIKHVIIIVGENRSFDHIFGAYEPRPGQSIFNILSQGIIKADGSPGPNLAKARQYRAQVTQAYDPAPTDKEVYGVLPPAMTDNTPTEPSNKRPPFSSLSLAAELDAGISAADRHLLLIGASGLPQNAIDTRLANATSLPNGPHQLTPGIPYNAYAANPVHRFFQMWQQMDCSVRNVSAANPGGCLADLFPWVETSIGAGSNGKPIPADFNDKTTGEGSTAMGFYNVNDGDAPYLKQLADEFAISDNFHQAVEGGTGANHIMMGSGDAIWFSDSNGKPAIPPANQIENPNPQPGTNNYYTQDGYNGGSYVACADTSQPGVGPLIDYLAALSYKPKPNCEPGHYYLVNNYTPGYLGNGEVNTRSPFVVPPAHLPTIADTLLKVNVSFRYYGEGWNAYLQDPESRLYCDICNFLQYTPTIMTDPRLRLRHIRDVTDLYNDVADDRLPAVSFVKPSDLNDGHPASSKLDLFEAFVRKIIELTRKEPDIWNSTAIFVTFDEAGGYWDSGYVQAIDFFGDGPRIPLIVISPYSAGGRVVHTYTDHVSFLKFIEKNWSLPTVSSRSRDNLPNPVAEPDRPYVPTNPPALGDLMDMFHF